MPTKQSQRLISKEDLIKRAGELLGEFEVIGTKELSNEGIFYQPIKDAKDLYLGEEFAVEPVKKFFLEPSSWVLRQSQDNQSEAETITQPDKKRIIIGVRPCEARGLLLLDKLFGDAEYKDSLYINNRKRTIIVGLACNDPDKSCFCTSLGGSPADNLGMDILILETEAGLIAEIITDKGRELFGSLGKELDEGRKKSLKSDKEKRRDLVETKIRVPETLSKIFESHYWDEVSAPCISCGICTYLCPTCHCFDLVDEQRKRLRCYDGCSFPDFTLHAAGENPRPSKRERYRQRVFHKFDYFRKNFGENLCIGCGRCIRHCPVKIDIADIVDKAPITSNQL